MDQLDSEQPRERPPGWFVPAVFAAMAGVVGLALTVVGATE